jgi:hypothetical protein
LAFVINLAANIARSRRPRRLQKRHLTHTTPDSPRLLARVTQRE